MSVKTRFLILAAFLSTGASTASAQSSVTVTAAKDNTLYESDTGALSNGAGDNLFAGRVGFSGGGAIRRALLAFDLDDVLSPSAVIDSVQLVMRMDETVAGARTVRVHRLLADWGEGGSHAAGSEGQGAAAQANDATWLHTFFDSGTWISPGGDFEETASASRMVAGTGTYTWYSTQQLADDVRDWRASPSTNFGWILRGDEGSQQTAKRFVSRNSATNGPRLQIFYSIPTGTEAETPRAAIALSGNYPNPFRERTTIRFELDSTEEVTLEVFDVLGRRVETIAPGVLAPGLQEVTFYAGRLPAGVYFYRIEAAGRTATGSMLALE